MHSASENARSIDTHAGVSCDLCGAGTSGRPVFAGVRYKCTACPNYDACASCVEALEREEASFFSSLVPRHPRDHVFLRLARPVAATAPASLQHRGVYTYAGLRCSVCGQSVVGWRTTCIHCRVELCEACDVTGAHPEGLPHARLRALGAPEASAFANAATPLPGPALAPAPAAAVDAARFGHAIDVFGGRLLAACAAGACLSFCSPLCVLSLCI